MSKERKAKRKTWLYLVGQIILWWYFHLVFRMKVVGAENVPQEGPVLLCSNHLAKRDPVLLGLCQKRQVFYMAKEELFHYLLKRYQDGLLQRLERVLEEQGGDLLGALPALFDDLRAQRKHWAGLARMLSRNSDMRLGLRLSPLDRPDLGEWLVDRDRLDLRGEEDLMDIFRILIYISATAMTQAIFEEDSGPARARLCAQLDILRRGTAAPSATKT